MSAAGPLQGTKAPLGGSADAQRQAWGAMNTAGPLQGTKPPLGGSANAQRQAWGRK